MKKLLVLILSSALLVSCSGSKISDLAKGNKTQNISDLPQWVVIPDNNITDGVAVLVLLLLVLVELNSKSPKLKLMQEQILPQSLILKFQE